MSALAEGAIALTQEQREAFDEDGFFLVENALAPSEVDELIQVVDRLYGKYCAERQLTPQEAFQMRNIVAADPAFKRIMDHEKILPLVVDLFGVNIQLRTSHMDVRS